MVGGVGGCPLLVHCSHTQLSAEWSNACSKSVMTSLLLLMTLYDVTAHEVIVMTSHGMVCAYKWVCTTPYHLPTDISTLTVTSSHIHHIPLHLPTCTRTHTHTPSHLPTHTPSQGLADAELEQELGITNTLHRLKLRLAVQEIVSITSNPKLHRTVRPTSCPNIWILISYCC